MVAYWATNAADAAPTVSWVGHPQLLAKRLGARIVELRQENGLTQERLAWEAGLKSKGYLSRIERGERLPTLDVCGRLAHRLKVEVRDLFIFPSEGSDAEAMDAIRRGGRILSDRVLKLVGRPPERRRRER